jgi:hypothetical protein
MGLGLGALLLSCAGLGGCTDDEPGAPGQAQHKLTAQCVPAAQSLPADAWVCPAPLSLECRDGTGTATPPDLYVRDASNRESCVGDTLSVSVDSLGVGEQVVVVRDSQGAELCSTELTVTDTVAPVLTARAPLKLWPPNHKFHSIRPEDCFSVSDACDSSLQAEFVWASSDEPVDSIGDGHHAPDIQLSADC